MGELRQKFAKTLKDLRRKKDLSLIALGELIGISYATLSRYENGKQFPGDEELEMLARYFNVPVSHFIEDDTQEYDAEALEIAEMVGNDKDLQILFSKTKNLNKEQKERISEMIKLMFPDD